MRVLLTLKVSDWTKKTARTEHGIQKEPPDLANTDIPWSTSDFSRYMVLENMSITYL